MKYFMILLATSFFCISAYAQCSPEEQSKYNLWHSGVLTCMNTNKCNNGLPEDKACQDQCIAAYEPSRPANNCD